MADITMCSGTDCPQKARCYRFTAQPTPGWQSYFSQVPWDAQTQTCEHFAANSESKSPDGLDPAAGE